jgi:hypothetical protein
MHVQTLGTEGTGAEPSVANSRDLARTRERTREVTAAPARSGRANKRATYRVGVVGPRGNPRKLRTRWLRHKKPRASTTRTGQPRAWAVRQELSALCSVNTTGAALFRPQIPGSSPNGSSVPDAWSENERDPTTRSLRKGVCALKTAHMPLPSLLLRRVRKIPQRPEYGRYA